MIEKAAENFDGSRPPVSRGSEVKIRRRRIEDFTRLRGKREESEGRWWEEVAIPKDIKGTFRGTLLAHSADD